jgi:hypothetical protein
MKIAYKQMPAMITLILFAYIIWPHLGAGARPRLGNTVTPQGVPLPGNMQHLVLPEKMPHRDPFLKAVSDSYTELALRAKVHDLGSKQGAAPSSMNVLSSEHEKKEALLHSLPPLTGTVVSGDYCCAYIGGRQYEVGELLDAGPDNSYRVKQITKGHVTLESSKTGETLDLVPELEQRAQSSADERREP